MRIIGQQMGGNCSCFCVRQSFFSNLGAQETKLGHFKAFCSIDFDGMATVNKCICFVDDFISKNLLDNIFQGNNSFDFVVRISITIRNNVSYQRHVGTTLLEFPENVT
eukprot:Lithocolla_globosa_v1_NODE_2997_length_1800_cov_4.637249.p4 type:complete len:108 gc:universal NODE_2997_length_1800_cov_4.637249:676-353(-)